MIFTTQRLSALSAAMSLKVRGNGNRPRLARGGAVARWIFLFAALVVSMTALPHAASAAVSCPAMGSNTWVTANAATPACTLNGANPANGLKVEPFAGEIDFTHYVNSSSSTNTPSCTGDCFADVGFAACFTGTCTATYSYTDNNGQTVSTSAITFNLSGDSASSFSVSGGGFDATPSVSIAVSPASVSEDGATNLTYTVTRSINLASETVVNITTTGTSTSGTDYTGNVATVTIAAGATTATIPINPSVDGTVEADETVTLTVAAGTGYTVGSPTSATGTILNDDVPTATIAVSPASVAEDGATNLIYTVTLNQAPLSPLPVNYTVGGTATNGTDYTVIASPLVIAAGATTGTITVNPTADASIEGDETVTLTLAAGTGYTVGVPNSATGTILNDDLPNLTINDVTASEGNAGITNFTFTVSLSAPAGPGGVTFDITTANGTATAGVDYVANSLTGQTIPAGSSTYTFTVLVNGDTLNEPTETFFANVTNVVNAVVVDGQGVGTVANDDPLPSLSINDVTVVEGNSGTTNAVFTVTLSAASGQSVSVNYATADGTATQPADYTSTSGTLTFTPGQTTNTITVPAVGEVVPEANETFFANLSGATNATISDNQGLGTISNDDVPVTVNPATLPNTTVAVAYSQTITASGGVSPYTFAITAGALPAGLTLAQSGALSGTPTAGGSFNFTVTATDSSPFPGPFAGSRAYTLVVSEPTIVLPNKTLAGGTEASAYSESITAASGGTSPYSYAVTAGALPSGLTLNTSTGAITGTPAAAGTFNFSITATDSSTGTGPYIRTQAYSITVIAAPPTAGNSSLTVAYNAPATNVPLSLSGGAATSVAVATQASHGTATASGTTITYQPATGYAGPDSFTYTATNDSGTSAAATVTITVSDPVITITPSGGFAASVAAPYTQTFTFNGGAQPWTGYQATNLPAGLSITGTTANTVTISGTPTQAGSFTLNVSATDSSTGNGPYTVGQAFSLTVAAPTLTLAPAGPTFTATSGTAFSQSFTASGGTGPYTYAVTAGALPAGLTLSNGTVSGTPTAAGSFNFTITATDTGSTGTGAPFTRSGAYTVNVGQGAQATLIATATPASIGYNATSALSTSGGSGTGTVSFQVTAGGSFCSINSTTLTGTGVGTCTVTATKAADADFLEATDTVDVTVGLATQTISFTQPADQTYSTGGTLAMSATGGASGNPVTFASTTTGVCTTGGTHGETVTFVAPGTCSITASQAGDANYAAATDVPRTFNIGKISQTISFAKPADQIFRLGATFTLGATGGASGNPVTFASTTTGVCTTGGTNGDTVTVVAPGTCSITASQAGDANYNAAANVTQTFAILQSAVTITITASQSSSHIGEPVAYTATVSSAAPPTRSVRTAASRIALVPTGTVTFTADGNALCAAVPLSGGVAGCTAAFTSAGAHVVTARYSGGGTFASATSEAITTATEDQTAKTTQAIGSFMSARNNQMLSNGPDGGRQIDRLMEAGGDGRSDTISNAAIEATSIESSGGNPGGEETSENFVSGFSGGAGRSALGAVTESRLGDGPGAGDMARFAFAGRSRGFSGGRVGAFNNPSNPFDGIAVSTADDDMETSSGLAQPMRMSASNDGPMSLGFGTSLRDFYRFAADAEARKTGGLSLGFAYSNQPQFNPFDIWIEGKYVRFDDSALQSSDLDGHFGFVTVGADYVLNRSLLVGMFVQFDSMEQRSNSLSTDVSGHGWMAGPYATVRLSENVFWQARAAWGTSSNTISPFLTYEDDFDSERWLASSTLSGRWKFGPWSFNPSASISYIEDASDAYHDTFGVLIPGVTSTLGQAKAGPEISYTFTNAEGGFIEPRAGMELIWNFAGDTTAAGLGAIDDSAAGPEGARGRVELGLKMGLPSGITLDLSGSYDGVGTSDEYHAISGRAMLRVPLN